ncbi:hypothetical protein PBAT_20005 [Paenibacillus antarcticus]|uniref:Uncharacterized protein n=1 Tax=Paenibacillus antarcticus TaxID=253703 RepID=A0A168KXA4_9BACL|nr:hypothetical protein PBAT_20005 [Paenibacillus antarcticus]
MTLFALIQGEQIWRATAAKGSNLLVEQEILYNSEQKKLPRIILDNFFIHYNKKTSQNCYPQFGMSYQH